MAEGPTGGQRGDSGTLFETDNYLDRIAAGKIEKGDELGGLLSAAAFQSGCQMPQPPVLADFGIGVEDECDTEVSPVISEETGVTATATYSHSVSPQSQPEPDELALRRELSARSHIPGWLYALAGAAASCAAVAGGLTVVHSAEPGGPLWGAHERIFGNEDGQLIELASTLDQASELKKQGDTDGALRLLDEAKRIVATRSTRTTPATVTAVRSVTTTVTEQHVYQESPHTVTVTVAPPRKTATPATSSSEPSPTSQPGTSSAPVPSSAPVAPAQTAAQ